MKKFLLGILVGYALHFFGLEAGNLLSELRWEKCIDGMGKTLPLTLPSGQHYCLGTVWDKKNRTWAEKVFEYRLDLYKMEEKRHFGGVLE